MEEAITFYEVNRLPWPMSDVDLVQEFFYRVDAAGRLLPGQMWNEEAHAALQALIDYRGPEALKPGRGNSLEEETEEESRLSHALALAMLSPEKRQEYHQLQEQEARIEYARELVRAAHKPVSFDPQFFMSEIEKQEDGTGLIEVMETGPNWTARYTMYILALEPEISILQAYTSFGEYSFNHHFQTTEWTPDESNQFDDFPALLARIWRDCASWLAPAFTCSGCVGGWCDGCSPL